VEPVKSRRNCRKDDVPEGGDAPSHSSRRKKMKRRKKKKKKSGKDNEEEKFSEGKGKRLLIHLQISTTEFLFLIARNLTIVA
jgi:hypothetical protein